MTRSFSRLSSSALFCLVLCSLLTACGGSAANTPVETATAETSNAIPEAPFRLSDAASPTHYALELRINPELESYEGSVVIDVQIERETSELFLHGRNLSIRESLAEQSGEAIATTVQNTTDEHGTLHLRFARALRPGPAKLSFVYQTNFDTSLDGIYRVTVGEEHYVFSQFESIAARKAFPCFDEPKWKTPFDVTLRVPHGMPAFSNSMQTGRTDGEANDIVRFATTAPLPTYLIAFAVGNFDVRESVLPPNEVRTEALPFRALAVRGRGAELDFTMSETPKLVAALERYTGIAYRYGKLDLVAVPDFAAGAMENPGLITFRDSLLLLGNRASEAQRRGFAYVNAHELAHQWFGDLVTMGFWDELWLNEAFATWAEEHVIAEVYPAWHADVLQAADVLEAYSADSSRHARRIVNPINTVDDINNAFDSITYSKGASVIRMVESWIGPAEFRTGIQTYLRAHADGTGSTSDLTAALTAAREGGPNGGEGSVENVVTSFTAQAGIPLLNAELRCEEGRGSLHVQASRYAPLGSPIDRNGTSWTIPFCYRAFAANGSSEVKCSVLTERETDVALTSCASAVHPNANGGGYYRFVPNASLNLNAQYARLNEREKIALGDSTAAAYEAGNIDFEAGANALAPLARENFSVMVSMPLQFWSQALGMVNEENREAFRIKAKALTDALTRLGLTDRANDTGETKLVRARLASFAALLVRDARVRDSLLRLVPRVLTQNRLQQDARVPSDMISAVLAVYVEERGLDAVNSLIAALANTQDASLRRAALSALARNPEAAVLDRALRLTLDETIRLNEVFSILNGGISRFETRDATMQFLQENFAALSTRLGPVMTGYLSSFSGAYCTDQKATEFETFFRPRMQSTVGGEHNLDQVIEQVQTCSTLRAQQLESINRVATAPVAAGRRR